MTLLAVFVALALFGHAQTTTIASPTRSFWNQLQALSQTVAALRNEIRGNSGAIYTRWGRTTCPPRSELIFEGLAAGSWYSVAGGGANYLCMPSHPEWTHVQHTSHACGSFIYGSEYQTCSANIFSTKNAKAKSLEHQDVPCAVCQTTSRQQQIMIPARMHCPAGWRKEYFGFLMSSHASHRRTQYVCVDSEPEALAHGQRDENGALFYPVRARCGTLPCPPYTNDEEIPCVVCSK